MEANSSGLIAWVLEAISDWGYWGIVLSMGLDSACLPLPSEVVMTYAGYLAHAYPERYGVWGMGTAGAVGCVLGSAALYWAGRLGGRPFVERYGKYLLISAEDMQRTDAWFARYGEAAVCLTRMVPMVRTIISVPAGITRQCFGKFLLYTFLGSLPWCVGLAYVGCLLGEQWEAGLARLSPTVDLAAAAIVVLAIGLYVWRGLHARRLAV